MNKKMQKQFIDREISWMYFNHRVLQEAGNPNVPLLERLRFLGIYSNNLDEFYRVRVAILKRLVLFGADSDSLYWEGNPKKVLAKIKKEAGKQQEEFEDLFQHVLQALARRNIFVLNERQLNAKQINFIKHFYNKELLDALDPIIVPRKGSLPPLTDESVYLMIRFYHDEKVAKEYAFLEVPRNYFSRFIHLPSEKGKQHVILLDDVIRVCLPEIFRSLSYNGFEAYTVKVTRDAEMDFEQNFSGSITEKIIIGVKNRKRGTPVRLVYDKNIPKEMLSFLMKQMNFEPDDDLAPGGRYHNMKDFMNFPRFGDSSLCYKDWEPIKIAEIDSAKNMLSLIEKKDIYLHYPYHSFSYFIRLLREAAMDPAVEAIKISVYRLASNSHIVQTLINAALNGKQVTAVVELLARFDETANMDWSRRMREAGIRVIFGMEGLKVHSKLLHIKRKGGDIACVSSGNFHEDNARIYTDVAFMTSRKHIVKEVDTVFNFIVQPFQTMAFKHLLVSPQGMRNRIYEMIDHEVEIASQGRTAYMLCKMNHLSDMRMIKKLYDAARKGVKIRLMVRGNCSLITKGQDFGENFQVISVVDRYLEHERIFIFGNDGEELCYISSADWMTRNFDFRIEVAVPIYDKHIKHMLRTIVMLGLDDNVKGRIVDGSGENRIQTKLGTSSRIRSQWEIYKYHRAAESDARKTLLQRKEDIGKEASKDKKDKQKNKKK